MNTQELKSVIEHYIRKDRPSYAIMIDGAWGCGKTHFINEYVENNIHKKFIYVSLFGVTSKKQIEDNIFSSMIGISDADDSDMKKAGDFIANIFGAFSDKAKGSALGAFASLSGEALKSRTLKSINVNTIIIFDDLERAEIAQHHCLSKINEFVEHQKLKVVILCDESKVTDNKYSEYKEKVVLHTNNFVRSAEEIVDICFASAQKIKCKQTKAFKIELKEIIEQLSLTNIRTIQHGLNSFVEIVNGLYDLDFKYKDDAMLSELIFPAIAYSVGYKDFSVDVSDLEKTSINSTGQAVAYHMKEEKKGDTTPSKWDEFYSKILSKSIKRVEFRSIFELVCRGNFNRELIQFDIEQWELKEHGPDYPITNFRMDESISDKDFEQIVKIATSILEQDNYQFYSTAELYQFCRNFYFLYEHKAFVYDGDLLNALKVFALNSVEHCLNHTAPSAFGCKDSEAAYLSELFVKLERESNRLGEEKEKVSSKSQLLSALKNNEHNKLEKINGYYSNRQMIDDLFIPEFFILLPQIDNVTLRAFGIMLENRHQSKHDFITLQDEIKPLKALQKGLEEYLRAKENSLSTMVGFIVLDTVTRICDEAAISIDVKGADAVM